MYQVESVGNLLRWVTILATTTKFLVAKEGVETYRSSISSRSNSFIRFIFIFKNRTTRATEYGY